jgi:outer membrane protein assembly factor BamB
LIKNGLHNFSLAGIFKYLVAGLFLVSCSRIILKNETFPTTASWPQWGGNPQRTHYMPVHVDLPLELKWTRSASSAIGKSLVTIDGYVVYGTKDGRIECVSTMSGEKKGQIKIRGNFEATCVVRHGSLFVLRRVSQPALQSFDLKTGKSGWAQEAGMCLSEPLIVDDHIYITTSDGKFTSYHIKDGSRQWSVQLDAPSQAGPSYSDGVLVLGNDKGFLCAYDTLSQLIWKTKIPGAIVTPQAVSDGLIFFGAQDQKFYAFNLKDGKERWSFPTNGRLYSGCAAGPDCVVFGSTDQSVYCLNKTTGQLRWTFQAASVISTAPLMLDNIVFIGSLDKKLYGLSLDKGEKIWEYETKGRIRTDPVLTHNRLLFASEDDDVYCFGNP